MTVITRVDQLEQGNHNKDYDYDGKNIGYFSRSGLVPGVFGSSTMYVFGLGKRLTKSEVESGKLEERVKVGGRRRTRRQKKMKKSQKKSKQNKKSRSRRRR